MKNLFTLGGLVVVLVLFPAVNLLASFVRPPKLDLTEERLYTLSDGTRSILSKLDEPITLRFYYSEGLGKDTGLAEYARRVQELLSVYDELGGEKLRLQRIDPEPFSEAEDQAVGFGLRGIEINRAGDRLYFGLVGTNAVDDEQVIAFFDPSREAFLEYDLSELVANLTTIDKQVVGILSTLPVQGSPPNPMNPGAPGSPAWFVIEQLEGLYETRTLPPHGTTEIDEDVSLLVVIHPKDLPEDTRYAIDQFVLRGGKAIVFVDPHCEFDRNVPPGQNPMMAQRASDMPELLAAWGVELVDGKVAGDKQSASPMQPGQPDMVAFLGLTEGRMSDTDVVTGDLQHVNMYAAGVLRALAGATTALEPLLSTSAESMEIDAFNLQFGPDPSRLLNEFVSTGEELVLAYRIGGPASTAFPGRAPAAAEAEATEEPEAADEAEGSDEAEEHEHAEGEEHGDEEDLTVAEREHVASAESIHVIVVADADMLHDAMWVRLSDFFGTRIAQPLADNGAFLFNAVQNMSGSEDLIRLRSRGRSQRPFTAKIELQRRADELYRAEQERFEAQLRETERAINELQQEKQGAAAYILSPEQEAKLEELRAEKVETRKKLRDVQHRLQREIDSLGMRMKLINIWGMPLLVAAAGILTWAMTSLRRKNG